ncbi:MAG: polyprenyl synthetase family protein [Terriglobia bacterium]
MNAYLEMFRKTFAEVHAASKDLLLGSLSRKDAHLREIMSFVLAHQTASEYPYVFKYAFCRREKDFARIIKLAAAVHLMQSSAFVTDDIFDGTTMRYGQAAIHTKYGVSNAIIATELLQCVGLETISAELEKGKFHNKVLALKILNQMMRELYVGQYLDVYNTANLGMGRQEYYRVISLGVGNFFEHLARCGALLAGRPEREVKSLARFAYHYGMALFVTDDIVDVVDSEKVTGKSYATDLKNRRMRLPVILTLEMAHRRHLRFVKETFGRKKLSISEIARMAGIIQECGALDACRRIAMKHLSQAVRHLALMEPSLTTRSLQWLCDTLLPAQRLGS